MANVSTSLQITGTYYKSKWQADIGTLTLTDDAIDHQGNMTAMLFGLLGFLFNRLFPKLRYNCNIPLTEIRSLSKDKRGKAERICIEDADEKVHRIAIPDVEQWIETIRKMLKDAHNIEFIQIDEETWGPGPGA